MFKKLFLATAFILLPFSVTSQEKPPEKVPCAPSEIMLTALAKQNFLPLFASSVSPKVDNVVMINNTLEEMVILNIDKEGKVACLVQAGKIKTINRKSLGRLADALIGIRT